VVKFVPGRKRVQGGGTLLGLEVLDREVERGGRDLDGRARRLQRHHLVYRGTSLKRNRHPTRSSIGA
jgi:hypothetical protein